MSKEQGETRRYPSVIAPQYQGLNERREAYGIPQVPELGAHREYAPVVQTNSLFERALDIVKNILVIVVCLGFTALGIWAFRVLGQVAEAVQKVGSF